MIKKGLVILVIANLCTQVMAASIQINSYFNNRADVSYKDPYRDIYKRGENLEKVIIQAIESAKESIYIAVQELRLPNVAEALVLAQKNGIRIKLILENNYNKDVLGMGTIPVEDDEDDDQDSTKYYDLFAFIDTNFDGEISQAEMQERDAIHIIRQANIPRKDDTFDESNGSGLMHHKFMIIDSSKVIISSANFTLSGVHGDFLNDGSNGNSNGLLEIESSEVAAVFQEEFDIMWGVNKTMGSRFGVRKPYRSPRKITDGTTSLTIQFSPTSKIQHWPTSVNGLIGKTLKKAKNKIDMALFVYSDQEIGEILRRKVLDKPELKLNVLVEPKFAYRYYSELLDLWGLKLVDENCKYEQGNHPWRRTRRVNGGVPRLDRGDVLHHKFGIVDNNIVIFGSQNWSDAANFINDEYVVVIENNDVAAEFQYEFDRLMDRSRMGPPMNLLRKIDRRESECAFR